VAALVLVQLGTVGLALATWPRRPASAKSAAPALS
jgi:hypothetical protein